MNNSVGTVFLVGGGPGDPGLMTLKGHHCLQEAEVVIYDSLVNPALLHFANPKAELIFVGKRAQCHLMEQEAINRLLIEKAKEGKRVVRLKGGDPFLFGRGGEEAEALCDAGIPYEPVPGVPSPTAVAAYAGIPVTHRAYTSSLEIVTGHELQTKPRFMVEWEKLATSAGTILFLMGWKTLPKITANLIKHGRSPNTPVAVIQWGTRPEQRTVVGDLSDIAQKVKDSGLIPPTLIVVGEVVNLRKKLKWYEQKPLFGQRIVVTRSRHQSRKLADLLESLGAETLPVPTIKIEPIQDTTKLDAALKAMDTFDWIVFTSVNAVDAVFERLDDLGKDARAFSGVQICAIGPATAEKLDSFKLKRDLIPNHYKAESIIEEFKQFKNLKGQRFFLPRADIAPKLLPDGLRALGADPFEVAAYRTVLADPFHQNFVNLLKNGEITFVTFTSSSTAKNFGDMLGKEGINQLPETLHFASIGPTTSATAKECGLKIAVEAEEHTIPGLVKAMVNFIKK